MPVPKFLPKAELIGTFLETLLFGAYLVVLIQTVSVLRQRHKEGRPVSYLIVTSFLIFACVLQHWISDLLRETEAFTGRMDHVNAPFEYYADVATPLNMWKTASYIAVTHISDLFIIYRTFVVYGKGIGIIIVPILLWVAIVVTSGWATASLATVKRGDNVLLANITLRIKYLFVLTLALNLLCTGLISVRVWSIMRGVSGNNSRGTSRLSRVVIVMVESAAVYTAYMIALIVLNITGTPAMFIVLNSISPLIGIVFSSVILRVGNGVSQGDSHVSPSASIRFKLSAGSGSSRRPLRIDVRRTTLSDGLNTLCETVAPGKEVWTFGTVTATTAAGDTVDPGRRGGDDVV